MGFANLPDARQSNWRGFGGARWRSRGPCPRPSTLEHGLQFLRRERGSEVGIRWCRGVALRVEPLRAVRIRKRKDRGRFLVDGSLIGSDALAYRKAHVSRRAVERVIGIWLARLLRCEKMAIHLVVACNRRDGGDRKVSLLECLYGGQPDLAPIPPDCGGLRKMRHETDPGPF